MIKAVKILVSEDGQMMAKPCDADEADMAEAQPYESLEEIMAAVPELLEQSGGMGEKGGGEAESPKMEGEAELMAQFEGGFDEARGKKGY